MRTLRWLSTLAVLCLQAGIGRAEEERDSEALIQRGLEARRQGRDAEALALFEEADELARSPRTRAQIGLAHQALGHWSKAEVALDEALAADGDAWIEENRNALLSARAIIDEHLGWVIVRVNVPGATVEIDGSPHPVSDEPIRVTSGSVVLRVSAAGYASATRHIKVQATRTVLETVELTSLADAGSQPAPISAVRAPDRRESNETVNNERREEEPPTTLTSVGWALLGLGIGAVGFGSFLGIRTFQSKAERDRHCVPAGCTERGVFLDEQARALAWQATASITGGVVLLGGGVWLIVTQSPEPRSTSVAGDPSRATSLVPTAGEPPGGSWIGVRGTF